LTNTEAQMVMKKLHERPLEGHFTTKITDKHIGCWILVANYVHGHA
jgi:hypothetical protein